MEIINLKSRNYLLSLIRNIFCNVGDKIILPYFKNLKASEISTKDDDTDFVTLADKKSENYIGEQLLRKFDYIRIIGEESFFIKNNKKVSFDNNYYWTIDPIDGTKNYINSNKNFCSMISLIYKKISIASFIYFPIENDMIFAFKGFGAYELDFKTNITKKIFISNKFTFHGTGGTKGIPEPYRSEILKNLKLNVKRTFIGSAGVETKYFVKNKLNFIIHGRVTPWDHSPLSLIVKEAGGVALMMRDRSEFNLLSDGPIIACSNQDYWNQIRDLLLPLSGKNRYFLI